MRLAVSQTLRSAAVVLLGCLAASVAFAQISPGLHNNPGPPPPPTQNVVVVNGTGQPVPTAPQGTTNVAGTVNVGNTPSVTVANTPSVNVVNTPSVSIAGTPTVNLAPGGSTNVTNPLDGQNQPTPLAVLDAVQTYEDSCTINFHGPPNTFGNCSMQAILPGKRLVIQEFDALGQLDNGLKPAWVAFSTTSKTHYFPAFFMGSIPSYADFFASHQGTRLYAPAQSTPTCFIQLTGISYTGVYSCQISGFLVDE